MESVTLTPEDTAISLFAEPPDLDLATHVTSAGFVQPISHELREDVRTHLLAGRLVYSIRTPTNPLAGYAIFRTHECLLYLAGIMLAPEIQAKGVAKLAVERARHDTGLQYLGLRTQSVRMWSAGRKMTKQWLPQPTEGCHDSTLVSLGESLAKAVNCQFPVTPGYYGSPLYGEKPVHKDHRLQNWWDQLCNFERGDAVICIGRF